MSIKIFNVIAMAILVVMVFACKDKKKENNSQNTRTAHPSGLIQLLQQVEGDSVWQEKTLYREDIDDLYQARIAIDETQTGLSYYWLGFNQDQSGHKAFLYESNNGQSKHLIDELDISEAHFEQGDLMEFFDRQYDNLIVFEGYLYYYKEVGITKEYKRNQSYNRNYFKYEINSKQSAEPIELSDLPPFVLQSKQSFNSFEKMALTNDLTKAAQSNGYDIKLTHIGGVDTYFEQLNKEENFQPFNIDIEDEISLRNLFPDKIKNDQNIKFISLCWDETGDNLFFIMQHKGNRALYEYNCNSACINLINGYEGISQLSIFSYNDKSFLAYTKGRLINISNCEYAMLTTESMNVNDSVIGINYTINQQNDGYWKRGMVYESVNKNEKLLNPRSIVYNDTLRFFFFGATKIERVGSNDSTLVNLYEYIPCLDKTPKVIRQYNVRYDWSDDFFYNTQLYNKLMVTDNAMYYCDSIDCFDDYSENDLPVSKYDYTKHAIVDKVPFDSIVYSLNQINDFYFSKRNNRVARHYKYIQEIEFFTYANSTSKKEITKTFLNPKYKYMIDSVADLSYKGYPEIQDQVINENLVYNYTLNQIKKLNDNDAEFDSFQLGYLSWDYYGSSLYFCNSNLSLACIWQINTVKLIVKRIVPEHDAIHPFYFEMNNKPMVFYVENNKLMVCEPQNYWFKKNK